MAEPCTVTITLVSGQDGDDDGTVRVKAETRTPGEFPRLMKAALDDEEVPLAVICAIDALNYLAVNSDTANIEVTYRQEAAH